MPYFADICKEFIQELPEALFLEDLEGKVLDVNEQACKLLDYEKDELLDMEVEDLVPEGAPAFLPGQIDEATRNGKPLETINIKKGGTKIPIELRGRIIKVDGKERILVSVRDISERKEAEEGLEKSEEKYRAIFESAKDAIFIMKADRFIDCNKETLEMFECKREDIVGQPPYEFSPEKQPDGRASAEKAKEKINLALEGNPQNFKWIHTTKDGEPFPAEVTLNRYVIEDEKFVMAIVRDITGRKKAEEALQGQRNKLRNLHDAVDKLQQQDTEEDVLDTVVDVAETMLNFRFCDISLLEGDYLLPKASATGLDPEESVPFEIGEGISGKTMQKGETIWGDDLRDHPEAKPTSEEFKAFISVPIGELGIFQVISEEVGSFTEQDVDLAKILAGHLREELTRVRLEKELRQQAIRDPLTDLYNRRYFNETLDKEIQQAKRYDKPLAFLMVDVNRFKEINDRYSHQTGDEVLREVANLLKENFRDADTVVRYGGDEFLIMMPETNGEATNAADRLKEGLNRWNRESHLLDFPLTLAMGVSHWSPDQERDVEEALNEADKKMYEGKRENR